MKVWKELKIGVWADGDIKDGYLDYYFIPAGMKKEVYSLNDGNFWLEYYSLKQSQFEKQNQNAEKEITELKKALHSLEKNPDQFNKIKDDWSEYAQKSNNISQLKEALKKAISENIEFIAENTQTIKLYQNLVQQYKNKP
jgi:predicted transcriptional regulator